MKHLHGGSLCCKVGFHFAKVRVWHQRWNCEVHSLLVPPDPPLAVQSTAILSASPVSTVKLASTKTLLDLRSRMSTVGSKALNGNDD